MQPTQLDPQVVNLAKAIRQTESGGNFNAKGASGESGAYQWTPATWSAHAQQALGDPKAPMTPANQNAVAYTVLKSWKDQGLNPAQIAAKWNSGSPEGWENKIGTNSKGVKYNVPQYVKSVTDTYQQFKLGNQNPNIIPNASTVSKNTVPQNNGITGNEGPLAAAGNAIMNTPGSALNFGIGVAKSLNPLQTASTIGQIGSGFQDLSQQEGTGKALWDIIKGLPEAAYETLVPQGVRSLISGDTQGASKAFQEDPFGQAAPLVFAAEGGAKLADTYGGGLAKAAENNLRNSATTGMNVMPREGVYTQAFDKGVSYLGNKVIDNPLTNAPLKVGLSVASHLTGLDPTTIKAVVSDPTAFNKLNREALSRPGIAEDFGSAIDTLEQTKSETGAEYKSIRDQALKVTPSGNFIQEALDQYGLKVVDGKIIADSNSLTRTPADINAIQKFYDNWGDKTEYTPNEFLNMRKDAGLISKFDLGSGKTPDSATIGRAIYDRANKTVRPQISGLTELDAKMSPQIEFYKKIKKDFLNADGTFKDGAANKIANAGGVGKENLLNRMEQVSPGITKSIKLLKAIEDIQRANGIKVGTYTRGIFEGGALLTGNFPALIATILTHPEVAVQILKGFGYAGKAVIPILNYLHLITGDIKTKDIPKVAESLGIPKENLQQILQRRQLQGAEFIQKQLKAGETLKLPAGDPTASSINQGRPVIVGKDAIGKESISSDVRVGNNLPVKTPSGTPSKESIKITKQILKANTPKISPYEPYTPADQLPVIKAGKVPKKVSNLPIIK